MYSNIFIGSRDEDMSIIGVEGIVLSLTEVCADRVWIKAYTCGVSLGGLNM